MNVDVWFDDLSYVTEVSVNNVVMAVSCTYPQNVSGKREDYDFDSWRPCVLDINVFPFLAPDAESNLEITVKVNNWGCDEFSDCYLNVRAVIISTPAQNFGANSGGWIESSRRLQEEKVNLKSHGAKDTINTMTFGKSSFPASFFEAKSSPFMTLPPDLRKGALASLKSVDSHLHKLDDFVKDKNELLVISPNSVNLNGTTTLTVSISSNYYAGSAVAHKYDALLVTWSGIQSVGNDWISYFCESDTSTDYHEWTYVRNVVGWSEGITTGEWQVMFDPIESDDAYEFCHFRYYYADSWDLIATSEYFRVSYESDQMDANGSMYVVAGEQWDPVTGVTLVFPRLVSSSELTGSVNLKVEVYATSDFDELKYVDLISVRGVTVAAECKPVLTPQKWYTCLVIDVTSYFPTFSNGSVALDVFIQGTSANWNHYAGYLNRVPLLVRGTLFSDTGNSVTYSFSPTQSPTNGPSIWISSSAGFPIFDNDILTVSWKGIPVPNFENWFGVRCPVLRPEQTADQGNYIIGLYLRDDHYWSWESGAGYHWLIFVFACFCE
jgi:hypothetical protein